MSIYCLGPLSSKQKKLALFDIPFRTKSGITVKNGPTFLDPFDNQAKFLPMDLFWPDIHSKLTDKPSVGPRILNDTTYNTCWHQIILLSSVWFRKGVQLRIKQKKSRIRETKHLSTGADSSTDTKKILLVRKNSAKNKLELEVCLKYLLP